MLNNADVSLNEDAMSPIFFALLIVEENRDQRLMELNEDICTSLEAERTSPG